MEKIISELEISRRRFVAWVVGILSGIISAVIGIPAVGYFVSPSLEETTADEWVPLGPVNELLVGVPKLYTFTRTKRLGWESTGISYGVYVIRKGDNEYDVFSNVCTHLSCRYTFREDLDHFFCACHGGHFAKDGTVLDGPPPRPLDRYEHRIEDGVMSVHITD